MCHQIEWFSCCQYNIDVVVKPVQADVATSEIMSLGSLPHGSRGLVEFLRHIDATYPPNTAIKLIDNHSAHISRETRA